MRVAPSHLRPISAFANSTERGKRRAHHRGRKTPNYVFRTRVERYQPEAGEYLYYFQSYTRSNIWIGKDILKRVCMRVSFFPGSFSCVLRYPAVRSLRSVCTAFAVINKSKYVMVIARRLRSNFFFVRLYSVGRCSYCRQRTVFHVLRAARGRRCEERDVQSDYPTSSGQGVCCGFCLPPLKPVCRQGSVRIGTLVSGLGYYLLLNFFI